MDLSQLCQPGPDWQPLASLMGSESRCGAGDGGEEGGAGREGRFTRGPSRGRNANTKSLVFPPPPHPHYTDGKAEA